MQFLKNIWDRIINIVWLKFKFKTCIFDQKMSKNDKKCVFFTQNSYIGAANPNFNKFTIPFDPAGNWTWDLLLKDEYANKQAKDLPIWSKTPMHYTFLTAISSSASRWV